MGGYGSGQWRTTTTKATTSQFIKLDLREIDKGRFKSIDRKETEDGVIYKGTLTWSETKSAGIEYIKDGNSISIRLKYNIGNDDRDYRIRIVKTGLHFGKYRYWFICPLTVNGHTCNRRVRVLFLRHGYFGCRHCHDLTYDSCQKSRSYDSVYRLLAQGTDMTPAQIKKVLRGTGMPI